MQLLNKITKIKFIVFKIYKNMEYKIILEYNLYINKKIIQYNLIKIMKNLNIPMEIKITFG